MSGYDALCGGTTTILRQAHALLLLFLSGTSAFGLAMAGHYVFFDCDDCCYQVLCWARCQRALRSLPAITRDA